VPETAPFVAGKEMSNIGSKGLLVLQFSFKTAEVPGLPLLQNENCVFSPISNSIQCGAL
jgi:hypothetical protein